MTDRLIRARTLPVLGAIAHQVLALYGVELPSTVRIGQGFRLVHHGFGTVIHPAVTIGDRVTIFHQVTVGRADAVVVSGAETKFEHIEIGDDVVLYPGAKVLGRAGVTRIGAGTIVAANAVVTGSTGEWEIWAGVPARKIGERARQ